MDRSSLLTGAPNGDEIPVRDRPIPVTKPRKKNANVCALCLGHRHKINDDGVTHANREWPSPSFLRRVPLLATILNFNVFAIVIFGFLLSLACVTLFALFYWSVDQECFVANEVTHGQAINLTFQKMFALSAQTFTTVGYGGIYVRCIGTNVLVTLEWYISLLLGATVTGILIVNLLSPKPRIRWSKQVLLTKWRKREYLNGRNSMVDEIMGIDDETNEATEIGYKTNEATEIKKCLTFRVVSQSAYQLTSFRLEAVAYIIRVDEEGNPVGTFIEPLPLLHCENVVFHQFGAAHVIDGSSPLRVLLSEGKWDLLQRVVCTATYHDPRFKADCVSYHTYFNEDLVRDAIFETMVVPGEEGDLHERWLNRTYDHSMIDEFRSQEKVPLHKKAYHPLPDGMA